MQTIEVYLQKQQSIIPPLKAKQNDRYSRFFKVVLLDDSTAFSIPQGAALTVRYIAPSGCGWYDTITEIDGKKTHSAFQVSENEVIVELAEAMLTLPGSGTLCLQIHTASGYRIGTWNVSIEIEEDPCSDQNVVASDYYNVLTAQIAQTLGYRDAAEKAATAAAQSATNASNKAVDANNSAGAADASAKAAKTSETNAASSASTAATKATAADASAKAAKTSETNAAASASTATTKAAAADTSAKAAKTSETNAAASASTAGANAMAAAESAAAAAESVKQASISKPNLLDNSNFEDPVNQRSQTTYSTAGYSIDRWAIQDGTLEVAANQVILTQGTTFYEILDSAKLDLAAQYTLSIEFENGNKYSITGTFTNVQKTIPYGKLGLLKSTLPYVSFTASVRCGIKNMKLELGDVATPYVAKTTGEEYAECLRYFCVGQNQILFGNALTAICPGRDFPVPMRVSPTVKIFGNGTAEGYLGTWGNANYSTIVAIAAKPNCIAYIQAAKNAAGDGMWTYAFHASADF